MINYQVHLLNDQDGSGTMSTYELRPAIEAMGYQLQDKVLVILGRLKSNKMRKHPFK